jgi:ABC-type glutathione transport system ATPase component
VGDVKAVDGVSFALRRGETLGVVGESGCGKSTMGRSILRLIEPSAGSAHFEGNDIFKMEKGDLRRMRRRVQIIFQDPFSSLNPRMTIAETIREVLGIHGIARGRRPTTASPSCCAWWGCGRSTPSAIRTSSRAGSGSASGSRGRWRWSRT